MKIDRNYYRFDLYNVTFDNKYYHQHIIIYIAGNSLEDACTKLVKMLSLITKIKVSVETTKIEKLICIDERIVNYSIKKLEEIIEEIKCSYNKN